MSRNIHTLEVLLEGAENSTELVTLKVDLGKTAKPSFHFIQMISELDAAPGRMEKQSERKSRLTLHLAGIALATKHDFSTANQNKWTMLLLEAFRNCTAAIGIMSMDGKMFVCLHTQGEYATSPPYWWRYSPCASLRIEFNFVDSSGNTLKSKSWEIVQANDAPPKTFLIQADATLLAEPTTTDANGLTIVTAVVADLVGELQTCVVNKRLDDCTELIAKHATTIAFEATPEGMHLGAFSAKPKDDAS